MHLLSINIGMARAVDPTRPHALTGIYKEPVPRAGDGHRPPGDAIISSGITVGRTGDYVYGGAD